MSVELVLENPEVLLRQVARADPVVMRAPGAADLFELGEGFCLDFPGDAFEPACVYERDYQKYTAGGPAVTYARVVQQEGVPDRLALQYWFFWYFNDWNDHHDGDWEGIQIVFDARTVEEALGKAPLSAGYAQHEGGERSAWDDSGLEREGMNPIVYPSAGSHASYFGSGRYMGRSGSEGFGCDNAEGPSRRVEPEIVLLPDAADDADGPFAWLSFNGPWGERHGGSFNGPTGPSHKSR